MSWLRRTVPSSARLTARFPPRSAVGSITRSRTSGSTSRSERPARNFRVSSGIELPVEQVAEQPLPLRAAARALVPLVEQPDALGRQSPPRSSASVKQFPDPVLHAAEPLAEFVVVLVQLVLDAVAGRLRRARASTSSRTLAIAPAPAGAVSFATLWRARVTSAPRSRGRAPAPRTA